MAVLGQLASTSASQDARGRARRKLRLEAGASTEDSETVPALIHNLSATGLLLETTAGLEDGELIEVLVPQVGARTAKVMWSDAHLFGCEFTEDLSKGAMSAALLRASFGAPLADDAALPSPTVGGEATEQRWSRRTRTWTIVGLAIVAWTIFVGLIAWFAASVLA